MSIENNLPGKINIYRHREINGRNYELIDACSELYIGDIIADSNVPFLVEDERLEVLKIEIYTDWGENKESGVKLLIKPFAKNTFYLDEYGLAEYRLKKEKYKVTFEAFNEEKCLCLRLTQ